MWIHRAERAHSKSVGLREQQRAHYVFFAQLISWVRQGVLLDPCERRYTSTAFGR